MSHTANRDTSGFKRAGYMVLVFAAVLGLAIGILAVLSPEGAEKPRSGSAIAYEFVRVLEDSPQRFEATVTIPSGVSDEECTALAKQLVGEKLNGRETGIIHIYDDSWAEANSHRPLGGHDLTEEQNRFIMQHYRLQALKTRSGGIEYRDPFPL